MSQATPPQAEKLTAKQQRFVQEYLVDLNASAAARRAGYSERTAHVIGGENLRKPAVSLAIAEAMEKRTKETKVDSDWVLRRLHGEATADLASIFNANGGLLPISEWPEAFRKGLVVGVESYEDYAYRDGQKIPVGMVRKVKLSDRIGVVKLIGQHVDVQAFREKVEHSGPNGGAIPVKADLTLSPSDAYMRLIGK